MANRIAAVYGSPGSGKTVTTVKIAKAIAECKQNVIIVGCDDRVPLIPLLMPDAQNLPSLGDALSADRLSQIDVLRHCIPFGKSQYISLLGYCRFENIMSYPEYGFQRATEFLNHLRRFDDDFVLFDCSSNIDNYLTAAALKQADVTFRIVNADPKSLLYFQSAKPLLLRDPGYRYDTQINVLNNILPSQNTDLVKEAVGEIPYTLPNVPEVTEQYGSAQLLDTVFGKTARQYTMGIKRIVKEVIMDEPERRIIRSRKAADNISGTA